MLKQHYVDWFVNKFFSRSELLVYFYNLITLFTFQKHIQNPHSKSTHMKAILIARVSTEEQREAGNSLPAQVARLERYCQIKGMPILNTYSFDESAYSN